MPTYIRIPGWADSATVNGNHYDNGTMALVGKVGAKSQTSFVVDLNPRIRLETWDNGAVSVHRGYVWLVVD